MKSMMKAKFIFLLLWSIGAAAQNKADLVSLELQDFRRLQGQFRQTKKIKDLNIELKSEGKFDLNKSTTAAWIVHWQAMKPKPLLVCIDEVGLVIDSVAGADRKKKNLKFSEVGEKAGSQISKMMRLMTLDLQQQNQDFLIEKSGTTKAGTLWLLTPKELGQSFFAKAHIQVSQGLVRDLVMTEKNGDEMHFEFFNLKTSAVPELKSCAR